MALPNTNISVPMVRAELGAATNDVGQLCIHPNINKWSRWKPVRDSSFNEILDWEVKNVYYGLLIPSVTLIEDISSRYTQGVTWDYLRPRGGSVSPNEPYRLSDFRNYNKNAEAISVGAYISPEAFVQEGSTLIATLPDKVSTVDSLGWDSFPHLKDTYFGVAIKRGAFMQYITSTETIENDFIANGFSRIEFPIGTDLTPDSYTGYAFLAENISTDPASHPANRFYLFDGFTPIAITLQLYPLTFTIVASWNGTTNKVDVSITVVNAISQFITLTNASIKLRYWDSDYDEPLKPDESILDIQDIEDLGVEPLGTKTITHSFTGISKSYSAYWKLWYKNEGTYAYNESVIVVE